MGKTGTFDRLRRYVDEQLEGKDEKYRARVLEILQVYEADIDDPVFQLSFQLAVNQATNEVTTELTRSYLARGLTTLDTFFNEKKRGIDGSLTKMKGVVDQAEKSALATQAAAISSSVDNLIERAEAFRSTNGLLIGAGVLALVSAIFGAMLVWNLGAGDRYILEHNRQVIQECNANHASDKDKNGWYTCRLWQLPMPEK